jgi:hypothetical protein
LFSRQKRWKLVIEFSALLGKDSGIWYAQHLKTEDFHSIQ